VGRREVHPLRLLEVSALAVLCVLATADRRTLTNEQDGVAVVLEDLFGR
jgi:hypothetical protein